MQQEKGEIEWTPFSGAFSVGISFSQFPCSSLSVSQSVLGGDPTLRSKDLAARVSQKGVDDG